MNCCLVPHERQQICDRLLQRVRTKMDQTSWGFVNINRPLPAALLALAAPHLLQFPLLSRTSGGTLLDRFKTLALFRQVAFRLYFFLPLGHASHDNRRTAG